MIMAFPGHTQLLFHNPYVRLTTWASQSSKPGQYNELHWFHLRKPRVLTPLHSLRKERSGVSTIGLRRCTDLWVTKLVGLTSRPQTLGLFLFQAQTVHKINMSSPYLSKLHLHNMDETKVTQRNGHFTYSHHFNVKNYSNKEGKFRNWYNQVPHLTQDTNGKGTNLQLEISNESYEVSPFPAGDHKATINRRTQTHNKHTTEITWMIHKRSTALERSVKILILEGLNRFHSVLPCKDGQDGGGNVFFGDPCYALTIPPGKNNARN